jgi:hypothetical protein
MLGSIARRSVVLSSRRSATKTRELRNLRRASRGSSSINARTPTRTVSVSHPTLGGLTERVERVVDTLDSMLRAGPKHLTVRQWQAGQIFRSAYEARYLCHIIRVAKLGKRLPRVPPHEIGHLCCALPPGGDPLDFPDTPSKQEALPTETIKISYGSMQWEYTKQ